jgi:hypothetical protein
MHSDYLELKKPMIDSQYLPKKYFYISGSRKIVQYLAVTSKKNILIYPTLMGKAGKY